MSRLKVRFDEPLHGWVYLRVYDGDELVLHTDVSRIYDSFAQLVTAFLALVDGNNEDRIVTWMEEEEPRETEMHFTRRAVAIRLEITTIADSIRPYEKLEPELVFAGTYDEICLPFWRALRSLEGRYKPEELAQRWKGYFPHHELGVLTRALGKE